MPEASPFPISLDVFHRERSRCVDAFATVELVVNYLLAISGTKCGGEPLGQRIVNLREAKPSSGYSKARKKTVDEALKLLDAWLPLRADLVHGRLQLAELDGEVHACFANARQAALPGKQLRMFELADLRMATQRVTAIATKLQSEPKAAEPPINPASSPPPPSRAAADGP